METSILSEFRQSNLIENTDQIEMATQELNAIAEQARSKGIRIRLK
ncbi:MAG: hypothetical protein ACYS21_16575 [Planctomycetota bacterium]